jgi:hypothetical protein
MAEANFSTQRPKSTSNNVAFDSRKLNSIAEDFRHVTFSSRTFRGCTETNHPLCPYQELNPFQYHAKPVPENWPHLGSHEPYPLYPMYFQVPSRYYSLGEEQVYATFPWSGCDGVYEIKSNIDGESVGDTWTGPQKRFRRVKREEALVQACSYIYNAEMTRPDRFFSWEEKPVKVDSSTSG